MKEQKSIEKKYYRYFDMVMSVFVTVLIVSNIASAAKVIDWGVSLGGMQLAFDAGTLLFPISYVFGDVLTEVYGYKNSRRVIWMGFACLALSVVFFWLIGLMPGEASWSSYAGQDAYNKILGGMSSGGIAIASLTAYLIGEFSNSFVLSKMKILTQGKWLWTRTIGSTLVGEAVDSIFFVLIATFLGVFPWEIFVTLVITNYIFKVSIEVIMTPFTYWVVNKLKQLENEDFYDFGINYNPFTAH
ncbi:MAG: queuosine precursor transporter [Anaerolineae bacterium]|nr:queuosine precursor transporter [Anaerolineae bacterium]